jgi:hypothetical protein
LAAVNDEELRIRNDNGRASAGRDSVIRLRTTLGCTAMFLGLTLGGCATPPVEPDSERLDSNTGTTVTVLPKPIELIVDKARGTKTDPFAYVAPFETNRMGSHEMFLWVSAPQVAGPLGPPQVFCGETAMPLEKYDGTVKDMGLSTPPYKAPAPWSAQWYFRLSGELLDCLASATRIRVVTQASEAEADSYIAEGPAVSGLSTFVAKVRT